MKKIKVTLILAMILSGILCLTGCGNGGEGGSTGKLKEKDAEVITIYVRDFEDWSNDYFMDAIDKYNENIEDGVEVVYELLDDNAYDYKTESAREAGEAPDIYMVSYSNLWQEAQNESIIPLEDVLGKEFLADYTDAAKDATSLYGKVYAIPYCFEPSELLFYSKSIFEKAGVTQAPQTYEEMLDTCEKLSKVIDKTQTVVATPLGLPMGWANVGQFYNAAGGKFPISDDWSNSLVGTENLEGYKAFLDYYSQLYTKGYASRSDTAGGYNEIINELCEGRVAMTFAGSYAVGQIYQDYIAEGHMEDESDIGCCLVPRLNADLGATTNGGWSFVLDASTTDKMAEANDKVKGKSHAELAADFIKWYVTDPEVSTAWFELGKCCKQPGFKSVQALLDKSQTSNPYYEVIKEATNSAAPITRYPYAITQACSDMISTLISKTNTKPIDAVIGICHKDVQEQINLNQLAGKTPDTYENITE